jgi:ketosteroid isomerase-like protein
MSEENVESIVRRSAEAFSRGDLDAVVADAAADIEYIATGAILDRQGVFRGVEDYKRMLQWMSEEFNDSAAEVIEISEAGDQVVVGLALSGRGKQSGVEASWNIWQVWTFQEGKFSRGQAFTTRAEALEAAGLSE